MGEMTNTGYLLMPALMKEQKESGKKDKYIEITQNLVNAKDSVNTKEEKLSYLKALIETLENMDFQIYELYRSLQDCFKAVLKELLANYEEMTEEEKDIISKAVESACALRLLLAEKYEAYVRKQEV